jgi:hypothetical protein
MSSAASLARSLARRLLPAPQAEPVIDISDEYVNWLVFAVPGMQNRGNLYCFDYAVRNLPSDNPLIEIGTFCGLSTCLLAYYKRRHGRRNRLVTCDRWVFEGAEKDTAPGGSAFYRQFVKESYLRNIRAFCADDLPFTVEEFSDDFFRLWRVGTEARDVTGRALGLGGPISFAFIDGHHGYEFAKRDFENVDEFLEPGGFILFDDSGDGSGWEVCDVVQEVAASERYELVIKNPNYFFRKK